MVAKLYYTARLGSFPQQAHSVVEYLMPEMYIRLFVSTLVSTVPYNITSVYNINVVTPFKHLQFSQSLSVKQLQQLQLWDKITVSSAMLAEKITLPTSGQEMVWNSMMRPIQFSPFLLLTCLMLEYTTASSLITTLQIRKLLYKVRP